MRNVANCLLTIARGPKLLSPKFRGPAISILRGPTSKPERCCSDGFIYSSPSEKSALENLRRSLNEQIEALNTENERIQSANAELQRQRDGLEDERDDREKDMGRQKKEIDRR